MEDILTNPSPEALVKAVEDNIADQFAYFGRSPRAEIADTPQWLRYRSGIPIAEYNGVVRAHFPVDISPDALSSAIQQAIDYFAGHRQSFLWRVGPSTSLPHFAAQLSAGGLTHAEDEPGMAMPLDKLSEERPTPSGLTIVAVRDETSLRDWVSVAGKGYGEGVDILAARLAVHQDLDLGDNLPLRRYVAYLDGQAVAMSALFLGAGVAGVYEVATVADARRRGIGTAITTAPLLHARKLGYRIGVLQASPMGIGIYTRLGFRQVCAFASYSWECAQ
ncbi:MAG TPA: GNAT family N-acetyltransferase [Ktedonobacterales bacterium]|jgi:GNAT superfamily N-acetyltransferase|nr:GNAT family N-acetyltransferase [Ktedonobacterales bacterium]